MDLLTLTRLWPPFSEGAGAARPTWTLALPAVRLTPQIDEPLALAGPIEQPLRLTRTILET
ncbi:MAG TPA: hypothetical protein VMW52_02830 [Phycisphaerae bacterium]|nr:hypothetical protein [Phycisphaerae bacterium]